MAIEKVCARVAPRASAGERVKRQKGGPAKTAYACTKTYCMIACRKMPICKNVDTTWMVPHGWFRFSSTTAAECCTHLSESTRGRNQNFRRCFFPAVFLHYAGSRRGPVALVYDAARGANEGIVESNLLATSQVSPFIDTIQQYLKSSQN